MSISERDLKSKLSFEIGLVFTHNVLRALCLVNGQTEGRAVHTQ